MPLSAASCLGQCDVTFEQHVIDLIASFRYEALVIAHGAGGVTTLEYNRLQYAHPLIQTVVVDDALNDGSLVGAFNVALSISSFEHDGLGRYGDPLNPNGDMIAMRSTRRLLKKGEFNQLFCQNFAGLTFRSSTAADSHHPQMVYSCSQCPVAPMPLCGTFTACMDHIGFLSFFGAGG